MQRSADLGIVYSSEFQFAVLLGHSLLIIGKPINAGSRSRFINN